MEKNVVAKICLERHWFIFFSNWRYLPLFGRYLPLFAVKYEFTLTLNVWEIPWWQYQSGVVNRFFELIVWTSCVHPLIKFKSFTTAPQLRSLLPFWLVTRFTFDEHRSRFISYLTEKKKKKFILFRNYFTN